MSEHIFGVTRRQHSPETVARAEAIARRWGCYVAHSGGGLPGSDVWGWFAGPNMGHPFDREREEGVLAELEALGIDWGDR